MLKLLFVDNEKVSQNIANKQTAFIPLFHLHMQI